jgi:hypothetical protein
MNNHLYASHSTPALFISAPALFVSTVSTPVLFTVILCLKGTLLTTEANLRFKQGINITQMIDKNKFMQPKIIVII